MQGADCVHRFEGVEKLQTDLGDPGRRQRPHRIKVMGERRAVHEFHDDPQPVLELDQIVDIDHAGMGNTGDGTGFTQRPPGSVSVAPQGQLLYRDGALQQVTVARQTAPMPPRPIRLVSWYRSATSHCLSLGITTSTYGIPLDESVALFHAAGVVGDCGIRQACGEPFAHPAPAEPVCASLRDLRRTRGGWGGSRWFQGLYAQLPA